MNIETLYENEQFNNLLEVIASRNKIYEFDDYKQDVFMEILDNNCKNMKACTRVANKIALRHYRQNQNIDIMSFTDNDSYEPDHEVMGRLVYDKKARYV